MLLFILSLFICDTRNEQSEKIKNFFYIGKGLGKNENGLTEALKPTLKFDHAGIGYSETNSEPWWKTLYDNTIKNIKVELHEDKVPLSKINDSSAIDGWSTISSKKNKKTEQQKYGNFLKSSTLLNGYLIQDTIEKEERTAKDSVYIPLTDEQLYKGCGRYKTTRHNLLNAKLERIAQQDRMFLNTSIGSVSQLDANLVKENTMTHRKTVEELDTEESEDPEENQEIVNKNTWQHETKDFVIRSKSAKKNHKKKLNKLTQQFSICSLKKNTDSRYNSQHDEELARIKKEKKSQLNIKSGKCSKKRKKNKRKKNLEQEIHISCNILNETSLDIQDKLKDTVEDVHLSKSKKSSLQQKMHICQSEKNPINSSSNNLNNKTDKDVSQMLLLTDKDRNMNIKQDIQQQKTRWEYFDIGKGNFNPLIKKKYLLYSDKLHTYSKDTYSKISFCKSPTSSTESLSYINNSDDKLHNKDKKIKRKIYQQKQIKKQLEKIINSENFCTDDLNNVIRKLTTFDLTEEVSANALKKKLTQTHLTPV